VLRKGVLAVLLLLTGANTVSAVNLEGYSQFMFTLNGESRRWRFENPEYFFELRLNAAPFPNTEMYIKTLGLSNKWDGSVFENLLYLREGHLKYRGNRIETYLFTGQDRFWLNEPLLGLVDQGIVKDDDYGPRAQGIRLDLWGWWGFTFAGFYSDKSTVYPAVYAGELPSGVELADPDLVDSDDYAAFRVRRTFSKDRLVLGSTYARKNYGGGKKDYDQMLAFDCELTFADLVPFISSYGRGTIVAEGGRNISGWLSPDEHPYGWKTELRDLGVGPLNLIARLFDYDDLFYTQGLASGYNYGYNDYHGHYVQLDYRIPYEAINLKAWRLREAPHTSTIERQAREETGGEVYVEFIHGFTGRMQYKKYINKDGVWPNWFFEVIGENKLVKLRTQYRIKDAGTVYQVRVFAFELNANITEQWKFYTRLVMADEKTEARESVWAQLQYLGWNSADFFVEFGDGGQNFSLANSEDFINHNSSDVTRRWFKVFLKLYY
jgi:hypothetical protein